ncbi:MAG: NAD-dependent epimerase/dehydratase family protein, partial [Bacteroidota bacterium]|nr:NAD-dependent epimerase/dehydratase family protein [Bacteroidota bacterium]
KVGGIVANSTYRGQFIYENLMIQNNVIHAAYLNKVTKLLFLGSTCIYPRDAPQPMPEDCLLTGPLEYTNEPYAIAKIAGIKLCESYNLQYGTNFISVMPTNLYGPNDNFDLEKSHVLPAMVRKMHLGKCLEENNWDAIREDLNKRPIEGISGDGVKRRQGDGENKRQGDGETGRQGDRETGRQGDGETGRQGDGENKRQGDGETGRQGDGNEEILNILEKYGIRLTHSPSRPLANSPTRPLAKSVSVELWGTGAPFREFLWSEEMADACVFLMENINFGDVNPCNPSKSAQSVTNEIRNTHINIGTGIEITIRDLANLIKEKIGFKGELVFNTSKPDGTMRKLTDPSKLHSLGWHHKIEIDEGISRLYEWYLNQ